MANLPSSSNPNDEKGVGSNTNPSLPSPTSISSSKTLSDGSQRVPPSSSKPPSQEGSSPNKGGGGGDTKPQFAKSSIPHNIFSYASVCGLRAPPHLRSSQNQPRVTITDPPANPARNSNVKGKNTHTSSSTTKSPSIEDFFETVVLKQVVNKPITTRYEGVEKAPNHQQQQQQSPQVLMDNDGGNKSGEPIDDASSSSNVKEKLDRTNDGGNSDDEEEGNNSEDDNYDGQIHSLPCNKHGPYKCSKCMRVFLTSQHFAAHVSSVHYKSETEEQRRMRQMVKKRSRNTKTQYGKDEDLTNAPIFYEWEDKAVPIPSRNESTNSKSADNAGGDASSSSNVKQKLSGNDALVPPGFEGVKIKSEPFA